MKKTYIYAYHMDFFERDTPADVIIEEYEKGACPSLEPPIIRMTLEEFVSKINYDLFDEQHYFVKAIEEQGPIEWMEIEDIRKRLKKDIIDLLKRNKVKNDTDEVVFIHDPDDPDEQEDLVYVEWNDKHDIWSYDAIVKIKLTQKGDDFIVHLNPEYTAEISLYASNDYGLQNVEVLFDIRQALESTLKDEINTESFEEPVVATKSEPWRIAYDEELQDTLGSNFAGVITNGTNFLFCHIMPDAELKTEIMHVYSSLYGMFLNDSEETAFVWTKKNEALLLDTLNNAKSFSDTIGDGGLLQQIRFEE